MALTTRRMPPNLAPGFDPSVLTDGDTLAGSGAGSAGVLRRNAKRSSGYLGRAWRSYTSATRVDRWRARTRAGRSKAAGALFTSSLYQRRDSEWHFYALCAYFPQLPS